MMPATDYDVLIIGSGTSGGMAAHTLTREAIKCPLMDAGPPVDFTPQPRTQGGRQKWVISRERRGSKVNGFDGDAGLCNN